MKHSANIEFTEAALALEGENGVQVSGPKAWWIVPFVAFGCYLWVQIVSYFTAFFS